MKKHLAASQARNRQLGEQDRKSRCAYCLIKLPVKPFMDRFCSSECWAADRELTLMKTEGKP